MSLLQDLLIEDIFTKVCPPSKVLMLRRTSKKFKDAMDNMFVKVQSHSETLEPVLLAVQPSIKGDLETTRGLTVHLKIYGFNIDNIYNNLKNMHKNYIITKIEFIRYNMFMFINLDKIFILCPMLTYLDLGPYEFYFLSLNNFQNCKIIHN